MEKRVTSKIDVYMEEFKKEFKNKLQNLDITNEEKNELLTFIYEYDKLSLEKDDFSKRKRIKSFVPHYLRCHAKRAGGEQCTRKKKDDSCYCGTHFKNRPHGEIDNPLEECSLKKREVFLQDINGVMYYIDKFNNVYKTEDIISNKIDPKIIAKYTVSSDNIYTINEN